MMSEIDYKSSKAFYKISVLASFGTIFT